MPKNHYVKDPFGDIHKYNFAAFFGPFLQFFYEMTWNALMSFL